MEHPVDQNAQWIESPLDKILGGSRCLVHGDAQKGCFSVPCSRFPMNILPPRRCSCSLQPTPLGRANLSLVPWRAQSHYFYLLSPWRSSSSVLMFCEAHNHTLVLPRKSSSSVFFCGAHDPHFLPPLVTEVELFCRFQECTGMHTPTLNHMTCA